MDFLTIGYIAKDILADGYTVGGTVTYASVVALRLGWRPAVITSVGDDLQLPDVYRDIDLLALPSEATTTFENIYTPAGRVQKLHALAGKIRPDDIPISWREQPSIVLLGPLANEVAPDVAALFPKPTLGVVPQGWMRVWDAEGRVSAKPFDCASEILTHADVLVLSVEDVDHDLELARCYTKMVDIMVLTRSDYGCDVYQNGAITPVPPRPCNEVDPTGAGDVFTAAFLIRLAETGDPLLSARFANVVASMSIEGVGHSKIPTRQQVEAWLAEND